MTTQIEVMNNKDFYCPVCKSAPLVTDYCPNCSRLGRSSGLVEEEIESLRNEIFKLRDALEQLIGYHLMIGNSETSSIVARAKAALK